MTIGIAAWGANAGGAVLAGLQAAERVGRGAIGGFVSWVGLAPSGSEPPWRAQAQRNGTAGLFDGSGIGGLPDAWSRSRCAGLMSSGPDRPDPLAQFTPARSGLGFVTGHRFPNTLLDDGRAFNDAVLDAIAAGQAPDDAVARLLAGWPRVDAGVLALTVDGRHAMGNTAAVLQRGDIGSALRGSIGEGAVVMVIHNSIAPRDSLAALVCEVAWDAMHAPVVAKWVEFRSGTPLHEGVCPAVWVDAGGRITRVDLPNAAEVGGQGVGLGDRVAVIDETDGAACGWLGYEPYLVIERGRVASVDGLATVNIPVIQRG